MAFPTIPTVAAGRVLFANQADTSGTRTFPNLSSLTKNSGDLLVAIAIGYQSSGTSGAIFSSWGASFTEFTDQMTTSGSTMCIGAAYKVSTGSETGTFTVTQAATVTGHATLILLSIPNANISTAPEAGTIANGTSSAADPGSFNPSGWDAEDTLWILVGANGMTSGTGSWTGTGATTATNYSDRADSNTTDSSTVGQTEGSVQFRQLNAASEDPGTDGGTDTSNARNSALLIAIRPRLNTTVTPGIGTLTLTAFAPTVTAGASILVTPGTASLTTTRFTPKVTIDNKVIPGIGALTLTRFTPSVTVGVRVTPGDGTLTLTSFAPTVLAPRLVVPGIATLILTRFTPTVLTPRLVIPGTAGLVLTAFAPTVTGGAGGGVLITPGTAALTLTTFAPTITGVDPCVALANGNQFLLDCLAYFDEYDGLSNDLDRALLQQEFLLAHGAYISKRRGEIVLVGGMYPVRWCNL